MNKKELGFLGEELLYKYLIAREFVDIKKNVFLQKSELDIIATKRSCLYFFEVRTIKSPVYYSNLADVVSNKISKYKCIKFKRGVNNYLKRNTGVLNTEFTRNADFKMIFVICSLELYSKKAKFWFLSYSTVWDYLSD